jgi:hypothetical protein
MKTEEAFLKKQFQAVVLETLKHKTQVLKVLLHRSTVNTGVVEVDSSEPL